MHERRKIFIFVGMFLALGSPTGSFAVDFASSVSYPVGTNPSGVVVADFSGDGKPDIAVANSGSGNVSILLGNGDGTFQAAVNYDVGITNLTSVAVGDFNGDGKLDLAVFKPGDSNAVAGAASILLGNGDGTFQAPKTLTLTAFSSQLVVADFNSDKNSDLVVSEFDPHAKTTTLDIFIGKGDGTFQAAKQTSVPFLQNGPLVSADFNGDSKPDLAVATLTGILILTGNGDGTFAQGTTVFFPNGFNAPLFSLDSVLTAELNSDGKVDLVASASKTICSVRVDGICVSTITQFSLDSFLGNGDGSFQGGQVVALNLVGFGGGFFPFLGDFNGDRKQDVGYANWVRLGRGDGTFSAPVDGAHSSPVVIADLNGDKLSDVIVLNSADNSIGVILNIGPTAGADLGIIKITASPDPIGVGGRLTYTADLLNEGPKDATGTTFTDTLPTGVSFVSATATQGSCIQSNGIVTCNVGSVASAFDGSVTVVVTPTETGTITNKMNVTATEQDLVPANNSAAQTTTVLPVFTLTVNKAGNGSGTVNSDTSMSEAVACGSNCSATFVSGTTVNLSEAADPGSLFQSWGGSCSGNGACLVNMDADKTVTANFVQGVTLSVSITGGGTGSVTASGNSIACNDTGGTCMSLYLPGTSVSLTASPSGGSTFGGWSGGCTSSDPNSCNVTLHANQTVTATFNPPPDFAMQPAATNLTIKRGGQASDILSFPAQGGFSGTIALTCSVTGPAPKPTCGLSPTSVTPGNSVTLTVNATGVAAALISPSLESSYGLYAAALPLGLFGCTMAAGFDKKRRRRWALCLLLMATAILPVACGSNSQPPPPQNYSVTVTATSGAIQHSTTVSVTVN